jgi:DNA-binding response OmpR family regulator
MQEIFRIADHLEAANFRRGAKRIKQLAERLHEEGEIPDYVENSIKLGSLEIDINNHKVTNQGTPVHFAPTELKLLRSLAIRKNNAVSFQEIASNVWDYEAPKGYVRLYITYLKRKFDHLKVTGATIENIWNFGYRLNVNESDES